MANVEPHQPSSSSTKPSKHLALFKYSNRILLKTLLVDQTDGVEVLIGKRVVIGGWVKSSKEEKIELAPSPAPPEEPAHISPGEQHKELNCVETFQTKIPFFKSILKVFGGVNYTVRTRLDSPLVYPKPQPSLSYLQVSDGSCVPTLLVVVDSSLASPSELLPTGTCILVEGVLQQSSNTKKHAIELKAEKVLQIGTVDQTNYVLSKKRLPLDMLRSCLHFRPRTTTVGSVMRLRSSLTFGTHTFFQNHVFLNVQVPIITSTDCDGSSEKFLITAISSGADEKEDHKKVAKGNEIISLDVVKAAAKEKSARLEQLKRTESNKEAIVAAIQDLKKTNELAAELEAIEKSNRRVSSKTSANSSPQNPFVEKTYLTVSGRLHLESYANALGNVYSFGPRFNASRVESAKLLPEMWMVETEMAFTDLENAMNCADDFFKFLCKWALDNCMEDMKFVCKRMDKTSIDRLQSAISKPVARITYTEAVEELKRVKNKMEVKMEWGFGFTTEHLSYLADELYKCPVIIYDYPKDLKPFYAKLKDDRKTVVAFDMIVPKVGKLMSGSQNELRVNWLSRRIDEMGLPKEQYEWYLDLKRQGAVTTSGFSLNFDLMLLFATGLTDVRDVIPFPRGLGKANI